MGETCSDPRCSSVPPSHITEGGLCKPQCPQRPGRQRTGVGRVGRGYLGGAVGETPASWGEVMSSCSMGSGSLQLLIYGNNVLSYLTCFPG